MIDVKKAYSAAKKVTENKYLFKALSFEIGYGFIFRSTRNEVEIGGQLILVDKTNISNIVLIPIMPDSIEFIEKGKEIPLTSVV